MLQHVLLAQYVPLDSPPLSALGSPKTGVPFIYRRIIPVRIVRRNRCSRTRSLTVAQTLDRLRL